MPEGKFVSRDVELIIDPGDDDSVGSSSVFDFSDRVQSATLSISTDTPEATAMGDKDRVRLYGLREWSLEVTFYQDFDSGEIDETLWDIIDNDKFVHIWILPDKSGGIGVNNPRYDGRAVLPGHTVVSGNVGDVSTITVTFQSSGELNRNTS